MNTLIKIENEVIVTIVRGQTAKNHPGRGRSTRSCLIVGSEIPVLIIISCRRVVNVAENHHNQWTPERLAELNWRLFGLKNVS